MLENISLSFQGIWSHKMRSFLTMLGIIIGIASIISIVSTIKGTNEQIKKNLIGSGNNTVDVMLYDGEGEFNGEYGSDYSNVATISDELMEEISNISGVENASTYVKRDYGNNMNYRGEEIISQVYGIDPNYFDTAGYQIISGRGFTKDDYKQFNKVVIMDNDTARSIIPEGDPLGKTIEIMDEPYVIVGITEEIDQFEPVIQTLDDYYMYQGNNTGKIFLPDSIWPISFKYDEPQHVILRTSKTEDMGMAGKECADLLNENITLGMDNFNYKSKDLLEQAKKLQELSSATNQQLLWIASISLLVGGIGVMNIMLVSVTERTREVGLKKAIGARKGKIMIQFLTEAAVLTSMGGLLGVGCGIILSEVISKVSQVKVAISVPAIIGSVVFSMLIGIIFGLLPSVKAANLNPIDALRHE